MFAAISGTDYYLPDRVLTNADLAAEFPDWSEQKIKDKTGIASRHIAAEDEFASDLAVRAAERLFARGVCRQEDVDFVLFCSQSPDYLIPTTACLIQDRLGIRTDAGALDFNLGCSGFVYGLSMAKSLIEARQASRVLLLTGETYSKHLAQQDVATRTIFGDAGTATLVEGTREAASNGSPWLGPFVFGTDGRGRDALISRRWSPRHDALPDAGSPENAAHEPALSMNGAEVFTFTLNAVPKSVGVLLQKSDLSLDDVDQVVFHQANKFMLEHLRRKLHIPAEKFVYALEDCGNTVSSTIPIALKRATDDGRIRNENTLMLVGFGVGYSWAAGIVRWRDTTKREANEPVARSSQ